MTNLSRSSLRRIVRQRHLPRNILPPCTTSSLSTSQITPRGFRSLSHTEEPQHPHQYTNKNIHKDAQSDLLQALDNVIQLRKSLGFQQQKDDIIDNKSGEHEIASWKKALNTAISKHDLPLAIKLFNSPPAMIGSIVDMDLFNTYKAVTDRLHPQNLKVMFDVHLRLEELYSNAQEASDDELPSRVEHVRTMVLNKLILAIEFAPSDSINCWDLIDIMKDVSNTIQCITEPTLQHELYPKLMIALIGASKGRRLSRSQFFEMQNVEKEVWDNAILSLSMMDNSFMTENYAAIGPYSKVLSLSTYRKQECLPFTKLLKALVSRGGSLSPEVVSTVIQNEYPFDSIHSVRDILHSLLRLQKRKSESMNDYIVDMGTLEHMCCVASRKGSSDAMLVLLNFMQEVKNAGNEFFEPTEGIYESMTQAFASSSNKEDHLVFGVLKDMELNGMKPSYIFLKGVSQAMRTRSTIARLDLARHMLPKGYGDDYNSTESSLVTTSALNVIISGYADLGFVENAYRTYAMFEELECEPDENSFAFLLEAVAMDATTAVPPRHDHQGNEWISSRVEIADALIEEAHAKGLHTNNILVHSYIEVLCVSNSLDEAKAFIYDIVLSADENDVKPSIDAKTFSILALKYAQHGDFESVDEITKLCISAGYDAGLTVHVTQQLARMKGISHTN